MVDAVHPAGNRRSGRAGDPADAHTRSQGAAPAEATAHRLADGATDRPEATDHEPTSGHPASDHEPTTGQSPSDHPASGQPGADGGRPRRAPWYRRISLRARLSVLTAGAVGVAILLAAIASYVVVSHQLHSQLDSSLRYSGQTVTTRFHLHNGFVSIGDLEQASTSASENGDVLQVVTSEGQVYFPYDNPILPVTAATRSVAAAAAQGSVYDQGDPSTYTLQTVTYHGTSYRLLTFPLGTIVENQLTYTTQGGAAVELAVRTDTGVGHPLQILKLVLLIVALCGIALAVGLGLLVARTTIRPVVRLTRAAEHVASTQDLDATIEEQGTDELSRLAHAFNGMLDALGASRRQQAQLVSDAGHELRTPLTSLRTNVEVLMRVDDLPAADRAELLGDIRAQVEELTTLIGDVVELAREDERQPEPTECRLDDIVRRAVDRAQRRAPGLSWEVALTPGSVRAQPALLERAVLNVLDNATKWSPAGETVDVVLRRFDRWHLDVRDRGPGIATEDLPKVFNRFYRAPTARAMPGSGLGLAIVHQVVTSHGGTVTIGTPPGGGTHVHIELPIVAEAEPDDTATWGDAAPAATTGPVVEDPTLPDAGER